MSIGEEESHEKNVSVMDRAVAIMKLYQPVNVKQLPAGLTVIDRYLTYHLASPGFQTWPTSH